MLKHPRDAYLSQDSIDTQWQSLKYGASPVMQTAIAEYDDFVSHMLTTAANVTWLPANDDTTLDSIYVRDASVVCDRGAILCNMGKSARSQEPDAQMADYKETGVDVIGEIAGDGMLEGGDFLWLDQRTAVVGQGYRTNAEGIAQLKSLLGDCADELITVPLPHWKGAGDVFHLMSMISPIDTDLVVVYSPLLPVPFRDELLRRGITLVEVPDEEFANQACNVLALGPRRCLMLADNPMTRERLQKAGAEVLTYTGNEISIKGEGGPTCLTRPVHRKA